MPSIVRFTREFRSSLNINDHYARSQVIYQPKTIFSQAVKNYNASRNFICTKRGRRTSSTASKNVTNDAWFENINRVKATTGCDAKEGDVKFILPKALWITGIVS